MTKERGIFCGFSAAAVRIPGLSPKIEDRTMQLLDKLGVKWELRLITDSRLSLYHRGTPGKPLHYQKRSAEASPGGVQRLLTYILDHEDYERAKGGSRTWILKN